MLNSGMQFRCTQIISRFPCPKHWPGSRQSDKFPGGARIQYRVAFKVFSGLLKPRAPTCLMRAFMKRPCRGSWPSLAMAQAALPKCWGVACAIRHMNASAKLSSASGEASCCTTARLHSVLARCCTLNLAQKSKIQEFRWWLPIVWNLKTFSSFRNARSPLLFILCANENRLSSAKEGLVSPQK